MISTVPGSIGPGFGGSLAGGVPGLVFSGFNTLMNWLTGGLPDYKWEDFTQHPGDPWSQVGQQTGQALPPWLPPGEFLQQQPGGSSGIPGFEWPNTWLPVFLDEWNNWWYNPSTGEYTQQDPYAKQQQQPPQEPQQPQQSQEGEGPVGYDEEGRPIYRGGTTESTPPPAPVETPTQPPIVEPPWIPAPPDFTQPIWLPPVPQPEPIQTTDPTNPTFSTTVWGDPIPPAVEPPMPEVQPPPPYIPPVDLGSLQNPFPPPMFPAPYIPPPVGSPTQTASNPPSNQPATPTNPPAPPTGGGIPSIALGGGGGSGAPMPVAPNTNVQGGQPYKSVFQPQPMAPLQMPSLAAYIARIIGRG